MSRSWLLSATGILQRGDKGNSPSPREVAGSRDRDLGVIYWGRGGGTQNKRKKHTSKNRRKRVQWFKQPSCTSILSSKGECLVYHLFNLLYSFRDELDLLLWGWLGKLKDRSERWLSRNIKLSRDIAYWVEWLQESYLYVLRNECHLIVERLILKLHPQVAFPKAMVNASAFFRPFLWGVTQIQFKVEVQSELRLKRSQSNQGSW